MISKMIYVSDNVNQNLVEGLCFYTFMHYDMFGNKLQLLECQICLIMSEYGKHIKQCSIHPTVSHFNATPFNCTMAALSHCNRKK